MRFTRLAALLFPLLAFSSVARAQSDGFASVPGAPNDLFDPVWNTMTQDSGGDSPGCRGCHVGPAPGFGRWFGDTRDDVLAYFVEGGGTILVEECRRSRLARALGLIPDQPPFMPRDAPYDGRFWVDCPESGLTELTDLGNWLDTFCF